MHDSYAFVFAVSFDKVRPAQSSKQLSHGEGGCPFKLKEDGQPSTKEGPNCFLSRKHPEGGS